MGSSSSSLSSKGSDWTGNLIFIHYNDDEKRSVVKKELEPSEILQYSRTIYLHLDKIIDAQIWKYTIATGLVGDWHEYTIVESEKYYWSFEKQRDALYVQRSNKESDVKSYFSGVIRNRRIKPEGRPLKKHLHGETIYNIMEWIINHKELDKTYHLTGSNCHYFASLLYEAIVRYGEERLDCRK